jgi:hypothetical protein
METKSRVQWLKEGERNTKFFHRSMVHRRYINHITKLEDAQGNPILDHEGIETELISYYKDLLSEPPIDRTPTINKSELNIYHPSSRLNKTSFNETNHAGRSGSSHKGNAFGKGTRSRWIHNNFFHYCWPMIREEVWKLVEESRTSGQVLSTFNATFLTLIPKEDRVTHPKQFHPIALCNVIYKIITKIIALWLKPILPFIISKEQSGYVEGCQIMDNIILVHEVIHSLKSTRTPGMLIKLDLSKYFDRLSWQYMNSLLAAFGFNKDWINWIMKLTTSAFFSILVNGVPSQPFSPTRGIHQGDPLSPFSLCHHGRRP